MRAVLFLDATRFTVKEKQEFAEQRVVARASG